MVRESFMAGKKIFCRTPPVAETAPAQKQKAGLRRPFRLTV